MSNDMVVHITDPQEISENIRVTRDYRLQKSDWTQMPDSPFTESQKEAWASYRQQLRDLPKTYLEATSFEEVIFPTAPEA